MIRRTLQYTVDEKQKSILITVEGYEAAEDTLQACPVHSSLYRRSCSTAPTNVWSDMINGA